MLSPDRYYQLIVEPTVREFQSDNMDIRRGMLAAQCVMHLSDHIFQNLAAEAKDGDRQARAWRATAGDDCLAFRVVVDFANAAKHCRTTSGQRLESSNFTPAPPAFAGVMQCGISYLGDTIGGITIHWDRGRSFNLAHILTLSLGHYKTEFPTLPISLAGMPRYD